MYVYVCRHAHIICLSYIYETDIMQGSYRGVTENSGLMGSDAVFRCVVLGISEHHVPYIFKAMRLDSSLLKMTHVPEHLNPQETGGNKKNRCYSFLLFL
jgi:hypothetical protein